MTIDIIKIRSDLYMADENNNGPDNSDNGSDNSDNGSDNSDNGSDNSDNGSDNSDKDLENIDKGPDNGDKGSDDSDKDSENIDKGSDNGDKGSDDSDKGLDNGDKGSDDSEQDSDNSNKSPDKDNTPDTNDSSQGSTTQDKKSFLSLIESHPLVTAIVGGIVATIVATAAIAAIVALIRLPITLEHQNELTDLQIKAIMATIESQNASIDELKRTFENETDALKTDILFLHQSIEDIYRTLLISTNLRPTEAMIHALSHNLAIFDDATNENSPTELRATTLVAYNVISLEEYTVEQIADKRILLPYMDGTKEVYFYGQLSPTGAWDGKCTINVYENGKLIFIKDAVYENGNLLSSRQVFSYLFKPDQRVWAISNRTNNGDHSEGETQLFKWESDCIQTFKMEEVAAKDIINVDTFRATLSSNLYAYYYGGTSNGFFNDTTGNSYMIHFFDNGTVRLLYVGNFVDGNFNDTTGNAWYIVKDENTAYMYYTGCFKDGNIDRSKPNSYLNPPLSLEQIKDIIGDRTFNFELYWDGLGVT